jgi:hypothetical protein
MLKLAQTYFAYENYQQAINTLDQLIKLNPNYKSTDGHLLYARSLEGLKHFEDALKEYKVVSETYPDEEGRVRYGLL